MFTQKRPLPQLGSLGDWTDWGSSFLDTTSSVLSAFNPVLNVAADVATSVAQTNQAIKAIKNTPVTSSAQSQSQTDSSQPTTLLQQPSNNLLIFSVIAAAAAVGLLILTTRGGK